MLPEYAAAAAVSAMARADTTRILDTFIEGSRFAFHIASVVYAGDGLREQANIRQGCRSRSEPPMTRNAKGR